MSTWGEGTRGLPRLFLLLALLLLLRFLGQLLHLGHEAGDAAADAARLAASGGRAAVTAAAGGRGVDDDDAVLLALFLFLDVVPDALGLEDTDQRAGED